MMIYAGLDVSDKQTHICVVDAEGAVIRRDCVASDPEALGKWLKRHCAGLTRVVLETGPLSTFLYHGLVERAVPVICICARHAKKALYYGARCNNPETCSAGFRGMTDTETRTSRLSRSRIVINRSMVKPLSLD